MMTSGKPSFLAMAVCFVTSSGCSSRIYDLRKQLTIMMETKTKENNNNKPGRPE